MNIIIVVINPNWQEADLLAIYKRKTQSMCCKEYFKFSFSIVVDILHELSFILRCFIVFAVLLCKSL